MNTTSDTSLRFLFTTWEGGGNVAPALTVARKLQERGHRVRFMSDEVCRDEVQSVGVAFRPWNRAPNRKDRTRASCPVRDWEAASPQEGIMRLLDNVLFGKALEYAQDVSDELDREPADVVLVSDMLPGVIAACEGRKQRHAMLSANLCFLPLPGMPAFGPGLPPPRTAEDHALHAQIVEGTIQMFDAGLEPLNHTRQVFGLPPVDRAADQFAVPPLFLLGTSHAFDWPINPLPPQIRYVGAQLDEPRWVNEWRSPWPAADRRPLIAIGFSTSFQDHAAVLQRVIDAAGTLPAKALVTLGQIQPDEVRPAGNTVIVQSAPHDTVMKQASVVVTHGGHGTVMRALKHRLQMLIIPHGRDQDENAVRVTERGAGLRLSTQATEEEIQTALSRLLHEPAFAEAARKLGEAIDQAGDVSVTHTLEHFASPSQRMSMPLAALVL